jgi:hypothetical protein
MNKPITKLVRVWCGVALLWSRVVYSPIRKSASKLHPITAHE